MGTSDEELNQPNEMEWIERRTHEMILRKYRLKALRIIKEFQSKIQQQRQHIETLAKEVTRQKFIIDTFENEPIEMLDNNESLQKLINSSRSGEMFKCNKETETEMDSLIYLDTAVHRLNDDNHQRKDQTDTPKLIVEPEDYQIPAKTKKLRKSENSYRKPSLLSIHIQPNMQKLNNSHICDVCNKPMSSRRVLAKHKRMVHCLQRKFICDHCSKAFCVRDGLKRHLRIHTGEKPFVCRGCQKGFNQSGNMRIHEKTCKEYIRLNGHCAD